MKVNRNEYPSIKPMIELICLQFLVFLTCVQLQMIIEVTGPKKINSIAKDSWKESFKKQLYKKNKKYIKTQIQPQDHPQEKSQAINHLISMINQEKITLVDKAQSTKSHSHYSAYIPLKKQNKFDDQFEVTFPFFRHLKEKCYIDAKRNCYQEVSGYIQKKKSEGNVQEGWQICLNKYLCGMDTLRSIECYLELMKKGTIILEELHQLYGDNCNKEVFLQKIMTAARYFKYNAKINQSLQISVDLSDEINETSIAKTMKFIFCSICLLYDCGYHQKNDNKTGTGFQYVHPKNIKSKQEHIANAISLCQFHLQILTENKMVEQGELFCSSKCYRHLNSSKWSQIISVRAKILSPIIKGLIKIGIQMFSYSPCQIWCLVKSQQGKLTCEDVFTFFMLEYNLYGKIEKKLAQSQVDYLMNESSKDDVNELYFNNQIKPKRVRNSKKNSAVVANSTHMDSNCFHYFVQFEPFDLNCQQCMCRTRGYCLPECQCDEKCPIKKKGCSCKKNQCQNNKKCSCLIAKEECHPLTCRGCFDTDQSHKKNNCNNNQVLMSRKKHVKIGVSNITMAGLGAFAGQNIQKDDLVIIYTGEIIDNEIDVIRQLLSHDLSFYNFGSAEGAIDARFMGNKSRFINHADLGDENLRAETIKTQGTQQIAFYAMHDIEKGDQLFFDYDGMGDLFKNHKHKYPFIRKKF